MMHNFINDMPFNCKEASIDILNRCQLGSADSAEIIDRMISECKAIECRLRGGILTKRHGELQDELCVMREIIYTLKKEIRLKLRLRVGAASLGLVFLASVIFFWLE